MLYNTTKHGFKPMSSNTVSHFNPSKIVCVGRNYAEHAAELGNTVPSTPIIFIKPPSSLQSVAQGIDITAITQSGALGALHFECELCVQLGKKLTRATAEQAEQAICGVTLGLDLTLRDMQTTLKQKGHPWERAKAFDGACVLGEWLTVDVNLKQARYQLSINQELRQSGDTRLMLFGIFELLSDISQQFTLEAGDIVMTGTPKGVGALAKGDVLEMVLLDTADELPNTSAPLASWRVSVR